MRLIGLVMSTTTHLLPLGLVSDRRSSFRCKCESEACGLQKALRNGGPTGFWEKPPLHPVVAHKCLSISPRAWRVPFNGNDSSVPRLVISNFSLLAGRKSTNGRGLRCAAQDDDLHSYNLSHQDQDYDNYHDGDGPGQVALRRGGSANSLSSDREFIQELSKFLTASGVSVVDLPSTKTLEVVGRGDLAEGIQARGRDLVMEMLQETNLSSISPFSGSRPPFAPSTSLPSNSGHASYVPSSSSTASPSSLSPSTPSSSSSSLSSSLSAISPSQSSSPSSLLSLLSSPSSAASSGGDSPRQLSEVFRLLEEEDWSSDDESSDDAYPAGFMSEGNGAWNTDGERGGRDDELAVMDSKPGGKKGAPGWDLPSTAVASQKAALLKARLMRRRLAEQMNKEDFSGGSAKREPKKSTKSPENSSRGAPRPSVASTDSRSSPLPSPYVTDAASPSPVRSEQLPFWMPPSPLPPPPPLPSAFDPKRRSFARPSYSQTNRDTPAGSPNLRSNSWQEKPGVAGEDEEDERQGAGVQRPFQERALAREGGSNDDLDSASEEQDADATIRALRRENEALYQDVVRKQQEMEAMAQRERQLQEEFRSETQAELMRIKTSMEHKEKELTGMLRDLESAKAEFISMRGRAMQELEKAQQLLAEKDGRLAAAERALAQLKQVVSLLLLKDWGSSGGSDSR
eukprot:TRINITY_DN2871_c0_g3_i1.p1 TRINITY_DN2871_c0_g3~~TRINITY_DN2871_c0_g3_i1.p1  ORF type:complete len:684 (-),score=160.32 TRINITY_DN2871_c0_g3_i1:80-2131(-)